MIRIVVLPLPSLLFLTSFFRIWSIFIFLTCPYSATMTFLTCFHSSTLGLLLAHEKSCVCMCLCVCLASGVNLFRSLGVVDPVSEIFNFQFHQRKDPPK